MALGTVDGMSQYLPVELFGRNTHVRIRVNDAELDRRAAAGVGAVTEHAVLEVLASLPADEWFDWSMLLRREQRLLRAAPTGVIERDSASTRRLLRPALTVEDVVVNARDARVGLEAASRFAPYAQRVVRLPAGAIDEVTMLDAALYGIGVVTGHGDDAREIVAPAPFVVQRWGWAQWLFTEQVLKQLLISAGR
jgi:hypothetical protein